MLFDFSTIKKLELPNRWKVINEGSLIRKGSTHKTLLRGFGSFFGPIIEFPCIKYKVINLA